MRLPSFIPGGNMGESYDTMRMFCVLEKDLKPLSIDHECRGIEERIEIWLHGYMVAWLDG